MRHSKPNRIAPGSVGAVSNRTASPDSRDSRCNRNRRVPDYIGTGGTGYEERERLSVFRIYYNPFKHIRDTPYHARVESPAFDLDRQPIWNPIACN